MLHHICELTLKCSLTFKAIEARVGLRRNIPASPGNCDPVERLHRETAELQHLGVARSFPLHEQPATDWSF
jgi:hypothetical protein